MYLVEKELRGQFEALAKTGEALLLNRQEAESALRGIKSFCVIGCGSSYSLAKSAALQLSQNTGIPAVALPAGDLLVNFGEYRRMLKGAGLLAISRSGSTSEVLRTVRLCKRELGCRVLSICAKNGAPIDKLADWSLCLPWAFDSAVCQTRTVSNLYAAALGLAYIAGGEGGKLEQLCRLGDRAEEFCCAQEDILSRFAQRPWTKAVVLGDAGMAGLMEEGALAFKEICRRDSNHYHLLDSRHGPMVQIDRETLVIALLSSGDRQLQTDLLADLAAKTGHLLALDCASGKEKCPGSCVPLPDCGTDDVKAVFALYCIQLICLLHAAHRGVDPDRPEGLDPWIKL